MLLAGGSTAALQAASLAIKQALPPICSGCLLILQARTRGPRRPLTHVVHVKVASAYDLDPVVQVCHEQKPSCKQAC